MTSSCLGKIGIEGIPPPPWSFGIMGLGPDSVQTPRGIRTYTQDLEHVRVSGQRSVLVGCRRLAPSGGLSFSCQGADRVPEHPKTNLSSVVSEVKTARPKSFEPLRLVERSVGEKTEQNDLLR